MMRAPRPYSDPYLAGVGLGLVLLASYVLAGRGIGASGAFTAAAAHATAVVAPASAAANPWMAERLTTSFLGDWIVVELLGVLLGGFLSAALAGRLRLVVDRGAGVRVGTRLVAAALGGAAMGVGAVFARGCTSGQALTGGALLSAGSWLFIAGAFGAGYLTMLAARGLWR